MGTDSAKIRCPKCGRVYPWSKKLAGRYVRCQCGQKLRVPRQSPSSDVQMAGSSNDGWLGDVLNEELAAQATRSEPAQHTEPTPSTKRTASRAKPPPRTTDRAGSILAKTLKLVGLMLLLGAPASAYLAYDHLRAASIVADVKPQQISYKQLIKNGPGDNAHVIVTDMELYAGTRAFTYSARTDEWKTIWVPAGPSTRLTDVTPQQLKQMLDEGLENLEAYRTGDKHALDPEPPGLVVKSVHVRNEEQLRRLSFETTFRGLLVNQIESLDPDDQADFKRQYPGTDFSRVSILEHNRKPVGPQQGYSLVALTVLLFVIGTALMIVGAKRASSG